MGKLSRLEAQDEEYRKQEEANEHNEFFSKILGIEEYE
jgi:hypothetical protein